MLPLLLLLSLVSLAAAGPDAGAAGAAAGAKAFQAAAAQLGMGGPGLASGGAPMDMTALAGNMEKFGQIYSMATQIMQMGGNFMGGGGGGGERARAYGENSILGDTIRPTFRGFDSEPPPPPPTMSMANMYGSGAASGGKTYGGASSGRSGIQTLLNTFLGSSVAEEPLPPPPTPKPRQPSIMDFFGGGGDLQPSQPKPRAQRGIIDAFLGGGYEKPTTEAPRPRNLFEQFMGVVEPTTQAPRRPALDSWLEMFGMAQPTTTPKSPPAAALFNPREGFGMGRGGASNIDGIINALMRNGVRAAEPEPAGPQALLSQFFGKRK